MPTYKLAPVRWELGQILLPEHFTAFQAALLAELRVHAAVSGLPAYGLAELSWHEKALEQGQLLIQTLTVVLQSGVLINVPGNAMLDSLSLKAAGATRVKVYLHVLSATAGALGNPLYVDDPPTLRRELMSIRLSTQPVLESSLETLLLAEFVCEPTNVWILCPASCPPLLQVGPHPFLKQALRQLENKLTEFNARLLDQLKDSFVHGGRLSAIRSCLLEVCQVQSLLADIASGVHRHPYWLFEALRRLYFEICGFHEKLIDKPIFPYLHDALADCFAQLFGYLHANLAVLTAPPSHCEMKLRDGRYVIESWPDELTRAEKVYLLVSRNELQQKVPLDAVKLASPERLELCHRAALRGVPFEQVANPPSSHHFIDGMDFYQLSLGEEWSYVQKSRGLCFYASALPQSSGVKVLVYWAQP